jgi:hypothetical protein
MAGKAACLASERRQVMSESAEPLAGMRQEFEKWATQRDLCWRNCDWRHVAKDAYKAGWQAASTIRQEGTEQCKDCDEAAKHAYSDATTPGFFEPKCKKHRASQASRERAAPCQHNIRTFKGWAAKCVDCGEIVNWEPHTEATKFVSSDWRERAARKIADEQEIHSEDSYFVPCERILAILNESETEGKANDHND